MLGDRAPDMPAPLETFLHLVTSGHNVLTPEMYQHFGGDAILKELQKYDPNARFTETLMGSEGSDTGMRLDFDATLLPKSERGMAGFDLNPSNLHENLRTNRPAGDDDVYGSVRNSSEFAPDQEALWTKLAPLVVSMGAPLAAGALAGAGIGAAGMTAGVTGSGLGGASSIPSWAAKLIGQAPSLAKQQANGGLSLMSILPTLAGYGGQAAGINPNVIKGALTLAQLAKQGKR